MFNITDGIIEIIEVNDRKWNQKSLVRDLGCRVKKFEV